MKETKLIITTLMFVLLCSCTLANEANLVGQAIWQSLIVHDKTYTDYLIKGLQSQESPMEEQAFRRLVVKRSMLEDQLKAMKRLQAAEAFFFNLKNQQGMISVIPEKLYYKQLKAGTGAQLQSLQAEVIASYEISTLDGNVICSKPLTEDSVALPISALMPGLAKAMLGMQEGEEREIFIHPKYGYSDIALLDDNYTLIVKTHLKEILSQQNQGKINLEAVQLAGGDQSEELLLQEYENLQRQIAYQHGIRIWTHYKWGEPVYALTDVIAAIREAERGKIVDLSSQESQKRLVDLHWKIYRKKEKAC